MIMDKLNNKTNPQYFEGILQLRDVNEEIINFVYNAVTKAGVNIAKFIEYPNGLDLYLSSNRFLRNLGKRLQESFTGQLKESAKLHTRQKQTGKELYRVTVLFKGARFKKGDIVEIKGDKYQIMDVKEKVKVKTLNTGKRKMFDFETVNELSF